MVNDTLLRWVGVLLIVLPFLGIPQLWKYLVLFTVGLLLIAVSLIARSAATRGASHTDAYADTGTRPYTPETTMSDAANVYDEAPAPRGYVAAAAFADVHTDTAAVVQDATPVSYAAPAAAAEVSKPKKPRKKRVKVEDVLVTHDEDQYA